MGLGNGEPEAKDARQLAKVPNFGVPGGLGPATLIDFAKGYGHNLSLQQARDLIDTFKSAYPEMQQYFNYIGGLTDNPDGVAYIQQLFSDRVRGKSGYCQSCNTMFQGLAADGCKEALWLITKECFFDESSPLYGTRMVAFIHDEVLAESPEGKAAAAAERMVELMIQGMKKFVPNVKISADPWMARRWYKGAEEKRNDADELDLLGTGGEAMSHSIIYILETLRARVTSMQRGQLVDSATCRRRDADN